MTKMEEFSDVVFWKVEGAGNDFIIIDLREPSTQKFFAEFDKSDLVRRLCVRRFGVGGDGAVLIKAPEGSGDFSWEFFNSDGSQASMCGNAARCVGLWGCLHVTQAPTCTFETDMGLLHARLGDDRTCEVAIPVPSYESTPFDVGVMHGAKKAFLVNSGVPHIVIEMSVWPVRAEQTPKIASLRRHPSLGKEGANVTLMMKRKDGAVDAVTYERGVENFTLSCGTGVIAAGMVLEKGGPKKMRIINPGGELTVRFDQEKPIAHLGGVTAIIFKAFLNKEILR